jgi:xanthine dehydrogenase/oxidase
MGTTTATRGGDARIARLREKAKREVVFYLNGRKVVVQNPDPAVMLAEYLRSPEVGCTGTKTACKEGGCGACSVILSSQDRTRGKVLHQAVNSCLRPLCSVDGLAVTTVEGLGSVETRLHQIQDRIAAGNGSQCGYCTPGFVMSMYGLLCDRPKPSAQEIEDSFDGNLCRCTGYRAILESMRSFASGGKPATPPQAVVLGEDGEGTKTPVACVPNEINQHPSRVPQADEIAAPAFPAELAGRRSPAPLYFEQGARRWYRPLELRDVYALKKTYGAQAKLVAANTSTAIYPQRADHPIVFIDLSGIAGLRGIRIVPDRSGIEAGATVTLTELLAFLDRTIAKRGKRGTAGLEALRLHVRRIGSHLIRNVATAAGNLSLTKVRGGTASPFPSDLATVLCGLGAAVTVGSSDWRVPRRLPLLEFFSTSGLPADWVVLSISIPFARSGERVRTYKQARRIQNSHALVNAAFRVRLTPRGTVAPGGATLIFGGIGSLPVRAAKTEAALEGKPWSDDTLQAALAILTAELERHLIPLPGVTAAYRTSVARGLFYKLFVSIAAGIDAASVSPSYLSAGEDPARPLSRGEQEFQVYPKEFPVSEPAVKLTAFIQASGEAIYTHDIPSPPRTLHGAMVLSNRAHATFDYQPAGGLDKLIESLKRRWPDVVDFLTVRDIPPGGKNLIGVGGDDPVFADGLVTCAGQLIGVVIAETRRSAGFAAVHIEEHGIGYAEKALILTVEEAIAQGSVFPDNPPSASGLSHLPYLERKGSNQSWLADPAQPEAGCRAVHGRQKTGAQAHFYMETQSTLVLPEANGELTIFASTQDQNAVQSSVAAVLGLPLNAIRVSVKLVGGGFGGKTSRVPFVSAPVALAALKHRRPVRIEMERQSDLRMIGKRHPFLGEYHAMFRPDGKMEGLKMSLWSDGGNTYDSSFFIMDESQLNADGAYMIPTYRTEGQVCRTNKPSNCAMRSFGVIQSSLVREEAIEHAAHELGMLPEEMRRRNLYRTATLEDWDTTPYGEPLKFCDIRRVWDQLWHASDFVSREKKVREFNRANRWRKRGISMIPLKYGVGYARRALNEARCILNVYAADGSVMMLQGGVEMGQGIHTKMTQIAAEQLNIPMGIVRPAEINTVAVGNAIATGASSGSDLNGGAVAMACQKLRKRLEEFCLAQKKKHGNDVCRDQGIDFWNYPEGWKAKVKVQGNPKPSLMWTNVVGLAQANRIDLTTEALFQTPLLKELAPNRLFGRPFYYYNYCIAVSEVEIDMLTGQSSILRSDLLYDAGKSLNPLLDIGQVQGAFVQGVGNLTVEEVLTDERGRLISDGTWEYKPPCSKTIPIDFRVTLLRSDKLLQPDKPLDPALIERLSGKRTAVSPAAIQSSRTVGEPPLILANTVFFAIKHAILAARQDGGDDRWFELESPATVERIQAACQVQTEQLVLRQLRKAARASIEPAAS